MTRRRETTRRRVRGRLGAGTVAALVVLVVFAVLWAPVLAGRRTLIGGDILYNFNPWTSEPAVHEPRNALVGDPVSQFVPWLGLVRESFRHWDLPLWNPYSFSGTPLLANDQSSPFSPFTLLALVFANPARGLSMAMLAKLWVAGLGMVLFLRAMAVRPLACVLGGISYATSAFLIVWLAYPHTGVAALLPWAFAGVEWYLQSRRSLALAAVAVAVAAQFLAGHAETSLHLGFALIAYVLIRLLDSHQRRGRALAALALAAGLGTLASGVQLVPFLAELSHASLLSDRIGGGNGFNHLDLGAATSWLVPNGRGNPGIDGGSGPSPNYAEATGFVGLGVLVLAGYGVVVGRGRRPNQTAALGLLALLSAGVVYGLLSPLAGRLPLLSAASNGRFLVVTGFAVAALGALGLDALLGRPQRPHRAWLANGLGGVGIVALAGLVGSGVLLARRGAAVSDLVPAVGGTLGFWLVVAGLSLVAAGAMVAAACLGWRNQAAAVGLVGVALAEGMLFAYPYNPRVPANEVPPPSEAVNWLRGRADHGSVAALGLDLLPDMSVALRLHDVRGVDTLINPRVRTYWSHADPGYVDNYLYTILQRPDARWLAAAGVAYVMTPNASIVPGTTPVYQRGAITIAEVADRRPFAFAAGSTVIVGTEQQAAERLSLDPLGPVVVERSGAAGAAVAVDAGGEANVELLSRRREAVKLRVTSDSAARVVVLQSFAPGWVARVDGRGAPIEAADILFQSVAVPPGSHTVDLLYRPASVRLGLAASGAGWSAIVALAAASLLSAAAASRRPPGEARSDGPRRWRRRSAAPLRSRPD